jgi:DNA polymerase IV (DinB-like DNA polymerase)
MPRIVLHVDLDAFYASVEERENPSLKGKPLVIGADPKGGKGRGVVATASYAARKYGIRSGIPISRAWKLCPEPTCIYLRPNFELYEAASAKVMAILRKHADQFEQGGIDEGWVEVSKRCKSWEDALKLAEKLKAEVSAKESLTVSVGIGPNKLVSKVASDFHKPDGLTLVRKEDALDFLRKLEPRKLPGIGPKTDAVLKGMGITTIGQLRKLRKDQLVGMFGKWGATMWEYARGIDDSPLVEEWEPKSIGRQVTFEKDTRDKHLLYGTLDGIAKEIQEQLLADNYLYRTVTLIVRYENFDTHDKSKSLKEPTGDITIALEKAKELLKPFLEKDDRKIRLIGLRVSKLAAH